ncbi:ras family-domain-containing protein [Anaeramoeba ignava]|uniref:Ras family-domain-containing protein n=1 Tax=Anaeramoeba ignava TaxID=1746090 RepID=A0A9Q0LRK0_ANAIG|nr:ras family-domain-containing protein [Anaeramoeba ignava]
MENKEKEKEYDLLFKFIIIGDTSVGKTSILTRYCHTFGTSSPNTTIGAFFKVKKIQINGKIITLQIWDTAGQERFRSLTPVYYRGTYGIVLVYDITNEKSFQNIENWIKEAKKYADENVQMILIGNKSDLEEKRKVSKEKGKQFADNLDIPFYEVSAKDNTNIDEAFLELTRNILENIDENNQLQPKNKIKYSIQDDFKQLFERKEFCDFEIECKDDETESQIKIPIHKLIIQNRLKINENQIENELYSILSQNSQKEVDILLKWIYFGKVSYQDLSILKEWKNKLSNICKIEFGTQIESFLKDLEILMNSEETKDFQIISNNQEIKVHKIILITRSELYRGMFNISEDKSNSVHEYSNKQTETIQSLIHFFYTDNIPKIENETIYEELKECVDYFQLNSQRLIQIIEKLKKKMNKKLKKNQMEIVFV